MKDQIDFDNDDPELQRQFRDKIENTDAWFKIPEVAETFRLFNEKMEAMTLERIRVALKPDLVG